MVGLSKGVGGWTWWESGGCNYLKRGKFF